MRAITIASAVLALVLTGAAASSSQAMTIKSEVQVAGPYVRLADVLAEPGEAGDQIVAEAPAPGETDRLSHYDVTEAAREAGLEPGEPERGYVDVRRKGRAVPESLLKKRIRSALARRGVQGPLKLHLTGLRDAIYVPSYADPAEVAIERLRHDRRGGRVSVSLRLPAGKESSRKAEFTGRVEKQTRVPVLKQEMESGQTIAAEDVGTKLLSSRRVNRSTVTAKAAVIGMEPTRPLRAEETLRDTDLRKPVLVEKGALVKMVVENGRLSLTAMGKAMENGAEGETIRLVNTDSNRNVEAVVIGHGRVRVVTAGADTLAEARTR